MKTKYKILGLVLGGLIILGGIGYQIWFNIRVARSFQAVASFNEQLIKGINEQVLPYLVLPIATSTQQ